MLASQKLEDMTFYSRVSLFTVGMFVLLEIVRLVRMASSHGRQGLADYFSDVWNLADWLNFAIFGLVWLKILTVERLLETRDCSSYLCTEVGYFDDWELMHEYRELKQLFSFNLCVQLFKVIKFLSALVPKMSVVNDTMRHAMVDLLFFGVVVAQTLFAFSSTLFVQLGPLMPAFYDNVPAALSLARGLFSDFDIDAILENSSGYFNTILFLAYLFVAVFILLSLFLSILAEAQVAATARLLSAFLVVSVDCLAIPSVRLDVARPASSTAPS